MQFEKSINFNTWFFFKFAYMIYFKCFYSFPYGIELKLKKKKIERYNYIIGLGFNLLNFVPIYYSVRYLSISLYYLSYYTH